MAGAVYTATGRFNGLTGKSMCLKVKETGAQSNTATSWTTGTGAWKDLPGIHYTALANGDTVNVTVIQKTPASGNSFSIDNMSPTTEVGEVISPPRTCRRPRPRRRRST